MKITFEADGKAAGQNVGNVGSMCITWTTFVDGEEVGFIDGEPPDYIFEYEMFTPRHRSIFLRARRFDTAQKEVAKWLRKHLMGEANKK